MSRTIFLVDGFNLYHSIRDAERDLSGHKLKWLDLCRLLRSYLPNISPLAQLEKIYYFSAIAYQLQTRDPGVTARHRAYIDALKAGGVVPILGRFKERHVYCRHCKRTTQHYEEKETDVAISVKLIDVLHRDAADIVVLVSGDTDLLPAVKTARNLFPDKQLWFLFPHRRKNKELTEVADGAIKMRPQIYSKFQFADPVIQPATGRAIHKPTSW